MKSADGNLLYCRRSQTHLSRNRAAIRPCPISSLRIPSCAMGDKSMGIDDGTSVMMGISVVMRILDVCFAVLLIGLLAIEFFADRGED